MNPTMTPQMRTIIRASSLISIPMTASLGSSVVLYFGTLNFLNASVHVLCRNKWVRDLLNIPSPSAELISQASTMAESYRGVIGSLQDAYKAKVSAIEKDKRKEARQKLVLASPVEFAKGKRHAN